MTGIIHFASSQYFAYFASCSLTSRIERGFIIWTVYIDSQYKYFIFILLAFIFTFLVFMLILAWCLASFVMCFRHFYIAIFMFSL